MNVSDELADFKSSRLIFEDPGNAVYALPLGPMDNFIYIILDRLEKRAIIVDPAWDAKAILGFVKSQDAVVTDILLTHSHHDHINAIPEVLEHTDAEIHLLKSEFRFWGQSGIPLTLHHGGEQLRIGKTPIEILHTPGHTPGSACYRFNNYLFTGDTLFVFGCGRCDLKGGDPEAMFFSLKKLQDALPGSLEILPGHDYGISPTSTLEIQKKCNPFLKIKELNRFFEYRMHQHDLIRHTPYQPECS